MSAAARVLRVLDPAERYFWLLDHLGRMNVVAIARLDRPLSPGELADALRAVQQRHALLRARIDVVGAEPVLVEAPGAIPLTVMATRSGLADTGHGAPRSPVRPGAEPTGAVRPVAARRR